MVNIGFLKASADEYGFAKTGATAACTAQNRAVKVGIDEIGFVKIGVAEVDAATISLT